MKVLKATLAFVMGLVLGVILPVLAIVGVFVALGTTRTVGELQSAVTDTEIISPDSELYSQTVLEAVQKALNDYQNFDDISLKLLYDRYGINLLQGISGLDFTKKDFYDVPITDIINDMSLLLNDIYLSDIETIAKMDLSKYNIPILDENMNVGITKAIDNIMALVSDDLSIRTLNTKLGFDLGAEKNDILKALQDVRLNELGGLIDVLPIGVLLNADTDTYLPKGEMQVYVNVEGTADEWEEVSAEELSNPDYAPAVGAETYISGGLNDELVEKELRYYQKEDGSRVVDNSCYNEGWTCPEEVKVVRHRLYKQFSGDGSADGTYYVVGYANRVKTFDNAANAYALIVKDFVSLDDIFVSDAGAKLDKASVKGGKLDLSGTDVYYFVKASEGDAESGVADKYVMSEEYSILEKEMKKNDMLRVPDTLDEGEDVSHSYIEGRAKYARIHLGEASSLLQYLNFLTIGYIRNDTDSILKTLRIGDIIDTDDPDVAGILKALKDSTLDTIGKDINTIPFGEMFKNESGNSLLDAIKDFTLENIDEKIDTLKLGDILSEEDKQDNDLIKALDDRGCTIGNIGSAIKQLTVGELLDVKYDKYEKDNAAGNYIKVPVYVKINADLFELEGDAFDSVFKNVYGTDIRRGTSTIPDEKPTSPEEFVEAPDGEYIETYYYLYQDDEYFKEHSVERYRRLPIEAGASRTAIAVQSLARRGVPALEMGDYINDLSIGELMEIDGESAQLFKTLARKGSTMGSIAKDIDDLEIADMIEINESSSRIMQALKARHCKIGDMATITDELTLSEILDIVPYEYSESTNGKYVHLTDPDSYVLYDEKNEDHKWRKQFVEKEDETGYDPYDPETDEGKTIYVNSAYYTLYNPAVHTALTIYDAERKEIQLCPLSNDGNAIARFDKKEERTDGKEPSSKILQRFEGATMGSFSRAFDSLMLSDVLDIDPDIYAEVDKEGIAEKVEKGTTLFIYKEADSVYSVASQEDIAQAKEGKLTLYHVETSGSSTSILKKLAYVKVNKMSDALETVMKDMMLSDIIEIHQYDAVQVGEEKHLDGVGGNAVDYEGDNKRYFIPWDGESKIGDKPIVYVYESTGKYIVRDEYYYPINEEDSNDVETYLGGTSTNKNYDYKEYTISDAAKLGSGNIYVNINGKYVNNVALATYYFQKGQYDKIYYRTAFGTGPENGKVYEHADTSKVFVNVLGEKTKYDPSNPAHCELQKYYHFDKNAAVGKQYIVPIELNWYEEKYSEETDVRLGAKYAREVMLRQPDYAAAKEASEKNEDKNVYVYDQNTNKYEIYDESIESHTAADAQYYVKAIGYVASFGEAFYKKATELGKCYSELTFRIVNEVEREHSSKILALLGNKTVNDMNSAIEGATIGDFMDVTPGTIFDDEAIRTSTLNGLGVTLARELSDITMGRLLEWSGITTGSAAVRAALNDVTLTNFFAALKYEGGTITFDMEILYGVKPAQATP